MKNKNKQIKKYCLLCREVFYVHISRKDTAKYCSNACRVEGQKGKPAWNAGLTQDDYAEHVKSSVKLNICLWCGKPAKNKFCSRSCSVSNRNTQNLGKSYEDIYGNKAAEMRNKISKGVAKTAKETRFTRIGGKAAAAKRKGKKFHEIFGKEKALKMKGKIRDSLFIYQNTPQGIANRKATSLRGIDAALSGKEFANSIKGYYKGIYYGSSLEKSFLEVIEKLLGNLNNIKRNTSKIISSGVTTNTAPDYMLVENGKVIGYIECKGDHLKNRVSVYDKAVSLRNHGYATGLYCGYFTYNTLQIFKELTGNTEPIQLNLLLGYMIIELDSYVVSWSVQRLSVEDNKTNKTLKNIRMANNIPNYPLLLSGRR